jgi:hypothetical protein
MQYRVTATAELREEPKRAARIVAEIAAGTIVNRAGRKDRRWVPVRHGGQSGWISERLLERIGQPEGEPTDEQIGEPPTNGNRLWSEAEIVAIIREAARRFNQPEDDLLRVGRCESNLDPRAKNDHGPYFGLFQFLSTTWATTPFADRDVFDPVANANAAAWMWQQGRRNEWACQ